jgi:uncharacterized protein (TIGR00255 family)
MNSMTGYGRATAAIEARTLTVQVSTVNRKTLDITVALPEAWEDLEPAVLAEVRKSVVRGKVHVSIEATGGADDAGLDSDRVAAVLDQLAAMAKARGIRFEPTTELLWQIASTQEGSGGLPPADLATSPVVHAVQKALRELSGMRAREGEALLVDFLGRLEKLRAHVEAIAARAPAIAPAYRDQLLQRLRAAGLDLDLQDERVLKEIALFADRVDVTEEVTRLRSHLHQLHDLLRTEGEVGRKAEFILQEIGREVHTIGSKANDLQISQRVIEFKNELERVREQIANVE